MAPRRYGDSPKARSDPPAGRGRVVGGRIYGPAGEYAGRVDRRGDIWDRDDRYLGNLGTHAGAVEMQGLLDDG